MRHKRVMHDLRSTGDDVCGWLRTRWDWQVESVQWCTVRVCEVGIGNGAPVRVCVGFTCRGRGKGYGMRLEHNICGGRGLIMRSSRGRLVDWIWRVNTVHMCWLHVHASMKRWSVGFDVRKQQG